MGRRNVEEAAGLECWLWRDASSRSVWVSVLSILAAELLEVQREQSAANRVRGAGCVKEERKGVAQ